MIVVWNVDYLKVSHADGFGITKFSCYLDKIYRGLAVKRVKVHNYLGVDLDLSINGKVKLSTIPYLNHILRDFPEHLGTASALPTAGHLFKVRSKEESRPLPEEQAVSFYHVVA